MDWLEGLHLEEYVATAPSQEERNAVGQALWDFYHFQFNVLKKVHADPHPGNFLVDKDGHLGVLDFGCVKEIPDDFYTNYFQLLDPSTSQHPEKLLPLLEELAFILPSDTPQERAFFEELFTNMIGLLARPFASSTFDFGDEVYFAEIYQMGQDLSGNKQLRKANGARGSKDGIYVNRAYFGLYSLLNMLQAKVEIKTFKEFQD